MQYSYLTLKWIEYLKCKMQRRSVNLLFEQYWNHSGSIETVRTVLKPSGQYWNRPDSIETIRTVLKSSGQYWNRPDSNETVRTVLKPSGQYWNCPDSIETVRTVLKLSGHYQYLLKFLTKILKCPDAIIILYEQLETIHVIWVWFTLSG